MRIISAIINLVPIYVLTFRENIPYIVAYFLLVRFYLLHVQSVGILLIFCDSVNRASQKQEFRQRDSETGRRKRISNNSLLGRLKKCTNLMSKIVVVVRVCALLEF